MATNVADSAQRTSHLCVTVLPLLFAASALLRAAVNCSRGKNGVARPSTWIRTSHTRRSSNVLCGLRVAVVRCRIRVGRDQHKSLAAHSKHVDKQSLRTRCCLKYLVGCAVYGPRRRCFACQTLSCIALSLALRPFGLLRVKFGSFAEPKSSPVCLHVWASHLQWFYT